MLLGLRLRDRSLSPQQQPYGCLTIFVKVVIAVACALRWVCLVWHTPQLKGFNNLLRSWGSKQKWLRWVACRDLDTTEAIEALKHLKSLRSKWLGINLHVHACLSTCIATCQPNYLDHRATDLHAYLHSYVLTFTYTPTNIYMFDAISIQTTFGFNNVKCCLALLVHSLKMQRRL